MRMSGEMLSAERRMPNKRKTYRQPGEGGLASKDHYPDRRPACSSLGCQPEAFRPIGLADMPERAESFR